MGTKYQQGYGFENRIVRKLNEQGGLAYRTAGSHSPIDITYLAKDFTFLIQCKHSKKKDIDINAILCDDNTLKLEQLITAPHIIKIILMKQARSNKIIQLRYSNDWRTSQPWVLTSHLDLT